MSSFFEFATESYEAVGSAPPRPAPAPRPSGGAATTQRGSAPPPRPSGGPGGRPAQTAPRPAQTTGGPIQPAPRPTQLGPRPAPAPGGGAQGGTPGADGRPRQPQTGTGPSPTPAPANRPATPAQQPATQRPSDLNLDRFAGFLQQGWDFVQRVPQITQQFTGPQNASAPASPAPDQPAPAGVDTQSPALPPEPGPRVGVPAPSWTMTGPPAPGPADTPVPSPAPGVATPAVAPGDQLAPLLQALLQRQIPPLPPPVPVPAPMFAAQYRGWPAAPQMDALSLLRLILINPQFLQALQPTATGALPRTLHLPVPAVAAPSRTRPVAIPLGAVINTIAALAGQSLTELHAGTAEDEPEVPGYLVDAEGEFIVDPASADDRAALVAHFFRINNQARQDARLPQPGRRASAADDELSKSDAWARDAGFRM